MTEMNVSIKHIFISDFANLNVFRAYIPKKDVSDVVRMLHTHSAFKQRLRCYYMNFGTTNHIMALRHWLFHLAF